MYTFGKILDKIFYQAIFEPFIAALKEAKAAKLSANANTARR
jgi:hypothetical protein